MTAPPPSALDMRHTKLKAEEAALIAGEVVKPSWASRNEGIHERVSFEDTLWGFEMAGGAFYKTPLRVAYVKPGSRAEQACIRMGDQVLRIQGMDTSTMTLQEAHQLVQDAGINLKIVVTSPDDDHDAHYEYQDPLQQHGGLTEEQLKALERERIQKAIAKAIRCRDLEWPWCRRKFIIYRESNCFMVPSKYENKHRDLFPELPTQRLGYFFPMDNPEKIKSKSSQNDEVSINSGGNNENIKPEQNGGENIVEDEEVEYVSEEEEVEENVNEEESQHEGDERLQDERIDELDSPVQKELIDNLENDIEDETEEQTIDNSARKDSEGSSNYDVDSNNNHVVNSKSKTEEPREDADQNSELDDKIINEIAESAEPNDASENSKTYDDVIDSVLSDEDTLNER